MSTFNTLLIIVMSGLVWWFIKLILTEPEYMIEEVSHEKLPDVGTNGPHRFLADIVSSTPGSLSAAGGDYDADAYPVFVAVWDNYGAGEREGRPWNNLSDSDSPGSE